MNKLIFSLLLTSSLFSCGEKEKTVAIPSGILPQEKMAAVLTDIHIAEAEANLGAPPDSALKTPISFHKIFEKDSVSKKQYEESLSFYVDHPELLDSIYTHVLNQLDKMQGEASKQ